MQAKIFKKPEEKNAWMPVIRELQNRGYDVYANRADCDKAIILSGKLENATVFDGEKVLIFHQKEWQGYWDFWKDILCEYYDKMVDVTKLGLTSTVKAITDEVNQP